MNRRIVVAISGEVSAGKSTAGRILQDSGFGYTRISWAIREKLREDGVMFEGGDEPSRRQYQEEGMRLHREKGQAWLCRKAIGIIPKFSYNFVADGLRWKDDVTYFRRRYDRDVIHLHIAAPANMRELWYTSRSKDLPFGEANSHEVEQEVGELAAMADDIITNDSTKDEFRRRVLASVELELHAR